MTSTRLYIATPMYGGQCYGHYVRGLLLTQAFLAQKGIPMFWYHQGNESLITRARNEAVRAFLAGVEGQDPFTHMLFIDSDIGFLHSDVEALLEADEDIVVGIYPKKSINWPRIWAAAKAGEDDLQDYAGDFAFNITGEQRTNEKGLIEVRHGATGFMMIKREVFEKLAPHVPEYRVSDERDEDGEYKKPLTKEFFATSISAEGNLLSEDYHFCELWREHGGRVFANPRLRLEHVGTHTYSGVLAKSHTKKEA